jgi:hypothetical protein
MFYRAPYVLPAFRIHPGIFVRTPDVTFIVERYLVEWRWQWHV